MRRVVIVGGGLAGHRAATALRRHGFDGELTLVGEERHRPYDRPPLSKQLLAGDDDHRRFYPTEELELTWSLGEPAVGLDLAARALQLAGGGRLPFDGLVLATGRRARTWPARPQLSGFHTLRTLDDAYALRDAALPGQRVAIVGAGFVGCEVAATLRGRGLEDVTLIDVAAHPMPALGPELGRHAARVHAEHGVRLRLDRAVASFEGRDRVEAVRLLDGERIAADVVLLALGSVPNSEWLDGSGLELFAGAVCCDEHCFALGAEDVVAAGDIAAFPYPGVPEPVWVEHWSNAREMAERAAVNLLAAPRERRPYVPIPTFWSNQYDLQIKAAGLLRAANRFVTVEEDAARPALVIEAYRDDQLVGAIVVNRNRAFVDYQRRLGRELEARAAETVS
ncbi:MAG: ferredoxin reductase [Conexibacter sp.]|nr:ferredoxin reductase [Conexibacter sp.]